MIKIMGGIMIFFSSALLGIYFARIPAYRISELESIKKALLVFKTEITYFDEPLVSICRSITEKCGYPSDAIFSYFGGRLEEKSGITADVLWKEAVLNLKGSNMSSEDKEKLVSFGKIIGYGDGQAQKSNIDIMNDYINDTIKKLENIGEKNKKMYTSAGILLGLMIITAML